MENQEKVNIQSKYDKINFYLNEILKKLNEFDNGFIQDNLNILLSLTLLYENEFNDNIMSTAKESKTTHLDSLNIVIDFFDEIDKKINTNYTEKFQKLIENGILHFDFYDKKEYNSKKSRNCYRYNENYKKLNICLEHNYTDAINIVHEFMHYTNNIKSPTLNSELLTEAISIYFEYLCLEKMIEKGISVDEFIIGHRILDTTFGAIKLNKYLNLLNAYVKFGEINDNTYDLINKYLIPYVDKKYFIEEVEYLYNYLCKSEEKYFYVSDIVNQFIKMFGMFKYIIGTTLACFWLEKKDVDLVNKINEMIVDNDIDIYSIFSYMGLNLSKMNEDIKNVYYKTWYNNIRDDILNIAYKHMDVQDINYNRDKLKKANTRKMLMLRSDDFDIVGYDKQIIGTQGLDFCLGIVLYSKNKQKAIAGHIVSGNLDNELYRNSIRDRIANLLVLSDMIEDNLELKIIEGSRKSNTKIFDNAGKDLNANEIVTTLIKNIYGIHISSVEYLFNNDKTKTSVEFAFDALTGSFITDDVYFGKRYEELNEKRR